MEKSGEAAESMHACTGYPCKFCATTGGEFQGLQIKPVDSQLLSQLSLTKRNLLTCNILRSSRQFMANNIRNIFFATQLFY